MSINLKKNTSITFLLIFIQLFLIFSIPIAKAETNIPNNFNQNLDLGEIYIYNVTAFNTTKPLEWRDVNFTAPLRGFANTTPGGQIKINFTGFYDKHPSDIFNIFSSPMPYMNVEFYENRFGNLVHNNTFYNVSNGEADLNLLFGYNNFKSGFLIPNKDFTWLKQQAYLQDEPPWMNASITIQETSTRISFIFHQLTSLQQRTNSTYDKISGLLVYTNTSFGNYTLEMTLTNLPNLPSEIESISSFYIYIICGILVFISIIFIIKLQKGKFIFREKS
ncbi:MAG: hypothetical protein JSV62_03780 [Promethearchaeota archaeon]|nr:MAG: hypothetical protein JSV62_03780 [Candidatus Lokiarchaeota archaeon]